MSFAIHLTKDDICAMVCHLKYNLFQPQYVYVILYMSQSREADCVIVLSSETQLRRQRRGRQLFSCSSWMTSSSNRYHAHCDQSHEAICVNLSSFCTQYTGGLQDNGEETIRVQQYSTQGSCFLHAWTSNSKSIMWAYPTSALQSRTRRRHKYQASPRLDML